MQCENAAVLILQKGTAYKRKSNEPFIPTLALSQSTAQSGGKDGGTMRRLRFPPSSELLLSFLLLLLLSRRTHRRWWCTTFFRLTPPGDGVSFMVRYMSSPFVPDDDLRLPIRWLLKPFLVPWIAAWSNLCTSYEYYSSSCGCCCCCKELWLKLRLESHVVLLNLKLCKKWRGGASENLRRSFNALAYLFIGLWYFHFWQLQQTQCALGILALAQLIHGYFSCFMHVVRFTFVADNAQHALRGVGSVVQQQEPAAVGLPELVQNVFDD